MQCYHHVGSCTLTWGISMMKITTAESIPDMGLIIIINAFLICWNLIWLSHVRGSKCCTWYITTIYNLIVNYMYNCMPHSPLHPHTHSHTCIHTHTHTRTRTHTCIHTHARAYTHTLTPLTQHSALAPTFWLQTIRCHWCLLLFVHQIPQLKPWATPMLGEKLVCAAVSPHLYTLTQKQLQSYQPLWLLPSNFWAYKLPIMTLSSGLISCQ